MYDDPYLVEPTITKNTIFHTNRAYYFSSIFHFKKQSFSGSLKRAVNESCEAFLGNHCRAL